MKHSKIEWTDATWNPTVGCSIVSPGCHNCYAMKMAKRLRAMGRPEYQDVVDDAGRWTGKVSTLDDRQIEPLTWKKPRRVFVDSMSDLFHDDVPDEFIDNVFAVMALCPQHTFQILTKRAERMAAYMAGDRVRSVASRVKRFSHPNALSKAILMVHGIRLDDRNEIVPHWPLSNIWLGVSVEDQKRADERIPHLLHTPAAVRFLSCEPLLGPLDLSPWLQFEGPGWHYRDEIGYPPIDWVIAGGESGPNARPMHPDWARSIRDQCQAAGVPFFFKQWGEWKQGDAVPGGDLGGDFRRGNATILAGDGSPKDGHFRRARRDVIMRRLGKKSAVRDLDGREWNEFPAACAKREEKQ